MVDVERQAVEDQRRDGADARLFSLGQPLLRFSEVDDLDGITDRVQGGGDVPLGFDADGAAGVVEDGSGHNDKSAGLEIPKRQYNKRFRLAARMERKRDRLAREVEKREITLIRKSRLASKLTWEGFSKDRNAACFVAYFTARRNLRGEFTIAGQQRPFDQVRDLLFRRCRASASTNWWAIAHAFPDREVLDRLDDARKGELLGRWRGILDRIASLLQETWDRSGIDRRTMIARKGNDSSTWNATAGARPLIRWRRCMTNRGTGGL